MRNEIWVKYGDANDISGITRPPFAVIGEAFPYFPRPDNPKICRPVHRVKEEPSPTDRTAEAARRVEKTVKGRVFGMELLPRPEFTCRGGRSRR